MCIYIPICIHICNVILGSSLMAQMVKNLPAMQKTWVWYLDQEDPLEEEMATYSSILPGKYHGQRSLVRCSPWCCKESDTTEQLTVTYMHTHTHACTHNGILLIHKDEWNFVIYSNTNRLGGHYAKWERERKICYHLYVVSKKHNKLMNITDSQIWWTN